MDDDGDRPTRSDAASGEALMDGDGDRPTRSDASGEASEETEEIRLPIGEEDAVQTRRKNTIHRQASGAIAFVASSVVAASARVLAPTSSASVSALGTPATVIQQTRDSSERRGREAADRLQRLSTAADSNVRQRRLDWVRRLSLTQGVIGLALYALSIAVEALGGHEQYMATPGFLFVSVGAAILSLCPADEWDVDRYFAKHLRMRILVWTILIASSITKAITPPHSNLLACGMSLWAAYGGPIPAADCSGLSISSLHSTAMFSAWMLLDQVGDGLRHAFTSDHLRNNLGWPYSALLYQLTSSLYGVSTLVLCFWFAQQRRRCVVSNGSEGSSPTLAFYQCLNGYLATMGMVLAVEGVYVTSRGDIRVGPLKIVQSVIICVPHLLVVLVGRDALYLKLVDRFKRQWTSSDGSAVVTELRDMPPAIRVGNVWWIANGVENGVNGQSSRWQRGTISQVDSDGFFVRVDESGQQEPGEKKKERYPRICFERVRAQTHTCEQHRRCAFD